MKNEEMFLCIDEKLLIISVSPISAKRKRRLEDIYHVNLVSTVG